MTVAIPIEPGESTSGEAFDWRIDIPRKEKVFIRSSRYAVSGKLARSQVLALKTNKGFSDIDIVGRTRVSKSLSARFDTFGAKHDIDLRGQMDEATHKATVPPLLSTRAADGQKPAMSNQCAYTRSVKQ